MLEVETCLLCDGSTTKERSKLISTTRNSQYPRERERDKEREEEREKKGKERRTDKWKGTLSKERN